MGKVVGLVEYYDYVEFVNRYMFILYVFDVCGCCKDFIEFYFVWY